MGDDLGLHAGDDSPWGADVPVPSHRPIEWDRRASSTGPESPVPNGPETSGRSDPTLDPTAVSEPFDTGPPGGTTMDEPTTNRTKLFVGIAVLGVLALGAASLAAGRDGSGSDATPATTEAAVADTAAPVATDVLDTIAPDSLPADTSTSQSDPAVDGRLPAPEPQARDDPPEWVAGSFEVPDILSDATVTTTIVVVTRLRRCTVRYCPKVRVY